MQAVEYQPRLSAWSQTWRALVVLVISGLGWSAYVGWQWDHNRLWLFSDLGLGLISFVLMFWRRRFPVRIAAFTALAASVSSLSGGPATLALVSLATRRNWRELTPIAVLSVAGGAWLSHIDQQPSDPWVVNGTLIASVIGVSIGWGLFIGSRRELVATLRDRAERAESEQASRLEQARSAERSRIAREMHDVLAHRISLVSMHAGALAYRTNLSAEQIHETAQVIQTSSHQALSELREVLGILRDDPGDALPELPQPSACDIPALIEEARKSGMKIDFAADSIPAGLPESIGRTLYRVIQEGLTNVRKHAPDTFITLSFSGSPGNGVSASIRNPLRLGDARLQAPASGLGLIGLAERAELAGGTLNHRITPDRIFVLRVWLPWPP